MSIVDCQNYPKVNRPHICLNCKHFVAKLEPVARRYDCSGFCTSEKVTKAFEYGYRVEGNIYMPVMSNGSCTNYEEW